MLTILDLFSGIGGFSYAAEVLVGGYKTIGFCEYDKKCQEVLKLRFPGVPIYPDIRELNEETLSKIHANIITGGYPCQPFSQAGKRGGEDDDRHLWPEMCRIISIVKPKYVICENVSGHISMGLDSVLFDLESEGYGWEAFIIPACALNAPHRRDRIWIIANNNGELLRQQQKPITGSGDTAKPSGNGGKESMAHPQGSGIGGAWATEPGMGRVANGIPARVDRLKGLGNAVVPQIPEILGKMIMQAKGNNYE